MTEPSPTVHRGPHGETLTVEQQHDIDVNKDVAAISYLWLLSVVIYHVRHDSPFIRFHSKQGMWLFVISIPIFLIPGLGPYLSFFTLAGMIIGFLNAAQGHYHDVPVIGRLARGTLTLGDIGRMVFRHGRKAADAVKRGVTPVGPTASPEHSEKAKTATVTIADVHITSKTAPPPGSVPGPGFQH